MAKELVPAIKLTICVGGDERRARHPLYREVLKVLHECNVAGATLTKGVMSFGSRRRIHSNLIPADRSGGASVTPRRSWNS